MPFKTSRLGIALVLSVSVAALVGACGGKTTGSTGHGGTGGASTGGASTGGTGHGGGLTITTGSGGNAQGFDVEPAPQQTVTVSVTPGMPPTVQTVTYTATVNNMPAPNTGWGLDQGYLGSLSAASGSSVTFTPSGAAAGVVNVSAALNATTLIRQILIKIAATQNGAAPTAPGENNQIANNAGSLTSGGGVGGVGGTGLGTGVTDVPTLMALANPAGDGQAQGLAFVYPYDKTVWPRGLPAPLLQWVWSVPGGAAYPGDADAIQITLSTTDGSFTYTGTFGRPVILGATNGNFINHPIPQDIWDMATNSAAGSANQLTVSLVVAKGGVGYGPITETWTVAPARLAGTIYYQSYGTQKVQNYCCQKNGTSFGAAVLSIHAGDVAPKVTVGDATSCVVCHSVAAFGSRLIVAPDSNRSARVPYDLSPSGATADPQLSNQGAWFPGLSPDGSRALTADGLLLSVPSPGTPLATSGLPAGALNMPAFSPDGTLVAFNLNTGPTLTVMSFDVSTGAFSNQATIAAGSATPGWPAFFPDNQSVVFENESAASQLDGHGSNVLWTREGAKGQIAWSSIASGATITPLDQLNGKGYLPKLPAPVTLSCIGDNGFQEGSSFAVNPAHDDDVDMNYEPTVNPIASGGYAWVVFTSRRMYGNVSTIPPFCSDPRGVDLTTYANVTPKKLWVAAVDLSQAPGADSSHPAFYLPAQELMAGNSRGFWVLDPCQMDGTTCMTGDQCCGGYCEATGDAGLTCSHNVPTGTCSGPQEHCNTAADCCDPTDVCLNGFCTQKTPARTPGRH